ncbi:hypothetical protein M0805_008677 [Coniferiporia weirii]|nr:hypothetical protein M0805_008677 [Coniferiporia weirii]
MYAQGDRSYPYPHPYAFTSSAPGPFRSHMPTLHSPYGPSYHETAPYFAHSSGHVSAATSSSTSSLASALDQHTPGAERGKVSETVRRAGEEDASFNPGEYLDLEALTSGKKNSPDDVHVGTSKSGHTATNTATNTHILGAGRDELHSNRTVTPSGAVSTKEMSRTGYSDMDTVYGSHFAYAQPHPQFLSHQASQPQPQHSIQPQHQSQSQPEHQPNSQPRFHVQAGGAFAPPWPSDAGADMVMSTGGFAPTSFPGGGLDDGFGSEFPGIYQSSGTDTYSGYGLDASAGVYGAWEGPNTNSNLVPQVFPTDACTDFAGYGLGGGAWSEQPQHLQPSEGQERFFPTPIPSIDGHGERPQFASGIGSLGRNPEACYQSAGPSRSQSVRVGAVPVPAGFDVVPGGEQGYYEVQHTALPHQLDVALGGTAADQFGYGYAQQGMQQYQGGFNQLYRGDRPPSGGHTLPAPANIDNGSPRHAENNVSSGREDMHTVSSQSQTPDMPSFSPTQPSASHPSYPYSYGAPSDAASIPERSSGEQAFVVSRQEHAQHTAVLMAPPPLPARVRAGLGNSDSAHTVLRPSTERRHTVAETPIMSRAATTENANTVSNAASAAAASPSPSVSSVAHASRSPWSTDRTTRTTIVRANTTGMSDAQWAQAQRMNRLALSETYRLRHKEEPPSDMDILHTSALQRSTVIERRLLAAGAEAEERRDEEAARDRDAHVVTVPVAPEDMSDEEFFSRGPDSNLVPARSGAELEMEAALGAGARARSAHGVSVISPITTNSPEEIVTPHEPFFPSISDRAAAYHGTSHPYTHLEAGARSGSPERPSFTFQKILPLLRHDGHLAPHVSGLGGTFGEAYDGRSYLPDDAEPDPNHVPPAPPGARIGDDPTLAGLRPHPLALRGERWHALMNPPPSTPIPAPGGEMEGVEGTGVDRDREESPEGERRRRRRRRVEDGVKEDEKGDGWGFVEGGSHGPGLGLGLPGSGDSGDACGTDGHGSARGPRLKLTTDKKTPPKMACLFCRNRKIACGAGKGEDKTCNQCERRNLRCVFPTESRRGMRTRKPPRSAHTVDGVDEAIKDSTETTEANEVDFEDSTGGSASPSGPSIPASQTRARAQKDARSGAKNKRARIDAKLKGKGKEKEHAFEDRDKSQGEGDEDGDIMMGNDEPMSAQYTNDPLASLASEARQHRSRTQASSPSTSLHFSQPSGPFSPRTPATVASPSNFPSVSAPGPSSARTQSRSPFTMSPLSRRKHDQGRGAGGN